jgi:hypothetical protein
MAKTLEGEIDSFERVHDIRGSDADAEGLELNAVVWALHERERSSHVNIADRGSKGVMSLAPKVLGCSRKSLSNALQ